MSHYTPTYVESTEESIVIPFDLLPRLIAPIQKQIRVATITNGVSTEVNFDDGAWLWDEATLTVTLVTLTGDPDVDNILVWRETRADALWVPLTPAAYMRAFDLNMFFQQQLFIHQEVCDLEAVAAILFEDFSFTANPRTEGRSRETFPANPGGEDTFSYLDIELLTGISGAPQDSDDQLQVYIDDVLTLDWSIPDPGNFEIVLDTPTTGIVRIDRLTKLDRIWVVFSDGFVHASAQIRVNQRQLHFLRQEECFDLPTFDVNGLLKNGIFARPWNRLNFGEFGNHRIRFRQAWPRGSGTIRVTIGDEEVPPEFLIEDPLHPYEFIIDPTFIPGDPDNDVIGNAVSPFVGPRTPFLAPEAIPGTEDSVPEDLGPPLILLSIVIDPNEVDENSSTELTATLSGPALEGGAAVNLGPPSAFYDFPDAFNQVIVDEGETTGAITLITNEVTQNEDLTMFATFNGANRTTDWTILNGAVTASFNLSKMATGRSEINIVTGIRTTGGTPDNVPGHGASYCPVGRQNLVGSATQRDWSGRFGNLSAFSWLPGATIVSATLTVEVFESAFGPLAIDWWLEELGAPIPNTSTPWFPQISPFLIHKVTNLTWTVGINVKDVQFILQKAADQGHTFFIIRALAAAFMYPPAPGADAYIAFGNFGAADPFIVLNVTYFPA